MISYGIDARSSCPCRVTDIEKPNTKTRMWHQWFNIRIRQYMILEICFVISLIMILYRTKVNLTIKPLEQSNVDVLKSIKTPTQDSTDKTESVVLQVNQSKPETVNSARKVPIPKAPFRFNAADYLKGASVDIAHSSSSNLNPIIGYDQTNLVLLDRPQPPSDKAWCTNDENPVLTINLAKYIKPISVSYQHSKWHGAIPNGTPKTYDVVACLDFYCEKWRPLVSNCEYSQYDSNEQMCNISSHLDVPLIGKVQFRFRENYGDTKMICVHLVRVYGETKTPAKIEQKSLKSEEICTDLRWYYHNSYLRYIFTDKNCTVLYENNCCSECLECCEECLISDYNGTTFGNIFLIIIFTLVVIFMLVFSILAHIRFNNTLAMYEERFP
ncbi:hypothetical protein B9Z55_015040 [Caenorhabditis nigoni]|uniref:SUN domain-containing protein n=1 Tax=Caenorhabditis nigoni TaxID=1611254 RepID=A0A2G5U8C3_9PELO|nr:hypothetical protein B9Z55_015040 [Caenorhabditis nigoni]